VVDYLKNNLGCPLLLVLIKMSYSAAFLMR